MDVLGLLRDGLDDFCRREATLRYQYATGLASTLPLKTLHRDHPLFSRSESHAAALEALHGSRTPESARPYLRRWVRFLAEQVLAEAAAGPQEEIHALEARARVLLPSGPTAFRDAEVELEHEPSRERRASTEAALEGFLLDHAGPYTAALSAGLERAASLASGGLGALQTSAASGGTAGPDLPACEALLAATEDAYLDVLGFALRRVDPRLKAGPKGRASLHDFRYAAQTPWLRAHLAPAEVAAAVTRCSQDWGFHPTAKGRIHRELGGAPGKAREAAVFAIEVPGDIRLLARQAEGGQAEFSALLEVSGQAQRLAHLPEGASVEVRRLPDAATTRAHGMAWRTLLTRESWHRRYLGATKPVAREASRMAALFALADLRAACARRLYEADLMERGPTRGLSDAFVARMGRAWEVGVPPGFALRGVGSLLSPQTESEAWWRAGELLTTLESRFNEDFYRNPAAGAWLETQWASDARSLLAPATPVEAAPEAPSLLGLGARLLRILGA